MKVKCVMSGVSVRTYQAHTGIYNQDSRLNRLHHMPTRKANNLKIPKRKQAQGRKKEKTRGTESEAKKITRQQGGCSEVKAGDTAVRTKKHTSDTGK